MSETFINRLVAGFLVPAIETEDHLERWKAVNRAAGLIAGFAFAGWRGTNGPKTDDQAVREAQRLMAWAIDTTRPRLTIQQQAAARAVLGENGLQKRVLAVLKAMIEAGGGDA